MLPLLVLFWQLDLMIFGVFFKLYDSMILWFSSCESFPWAILTYSVWQKTKPDENTYSWAKKLSNSQRIHLLRIRASAAKQNDSTGPGQRENEKRALCKELSDCLRVTKTVNQLSCLTDLRLEHISWNAVAPQVSFSLQKL